MKPITFLGDTLAALRAFPHEARPESGLQLDRVQRGLMPDNWKSMKAIGTGVTEIRVRVRVRVEGGAFRVLYVATFPEAVYVLNAFQKKTQKTARADLNLAITRYQALRKER
jgi:phage-related protein